MPSFRSFDGTEISYTVRGEGAPLILVNGLACVESYWKYTIEHFSPKMQVITYDLRGHGSSGIPSVESNVEIADHARDLAGLLRELNVVNPVVAGFSLGVQIMFETYRHVGDNLAALVAVTGPYRNPIATFYGLPLPQPVIDGAFMAAKVLEKPIEKAWRLAFRSPFIYPISKAVGACKCEKEDIQGFYDHASVMDVGLFFQFAQAASRHTAEDVLPNIAVPVLVVGAEKDTFTPPKLSEHMARTIPNADYLHVKGGTHTAIVEQPRLINERIEGFVRRHLPQHLSL
jgi:pimeloyl-ACP methyl ester carboxylesterase